MSKSKDFKVVRAGDSVELLVIELDWSIRVSENEASSVRTLNDE